MTRGNVAQRLGRSTNDATNEPDGDKFARPSFPLDWQRRGLFRLEQLEGYFATLSFLPSIARVLEPQSWISRRFSRASEAQGGRRHLCAIDALDSAELRPLALSNAAEFSESFSGANNEKLKATRKRYTSDRQYLL